MPITLQRCREMAARNPDALYRLIAAYLRAHDCTEHAAWAPQVRAPLHLVHPRPADIAEAEIQRAHAERMLARMDPAHPAVIAARRRIALGDDQ